MASSPGYDDIPSGAHFAPGKENELPQELKKELNETKSEPRELRPTASLSAQNEENKGLQKACVSSVRRPVSKGLNKYLPLSPRQERMYFMQMANTESRAFNLGLCLHLSCKKPNDILPPHLSELVLTVLKTLVRHHPHLRASIADSVDGDLELGQIIREVDDVDICSFVDLSTTKELTPSANDVSLEDSLGKEGLTSAVSTTCSCASGLAAPRTTCSEATNVSKLGTYQVFKQIDLTKQPFQCTTYKISTREVAIIFTFHHIIMDGTSLYIVSRDLIGLLGGQSLYKPVTEPSCLSNVDDCRAVSKEGKSKGSKEVDVRVMRKLSKWVKLLSSAQKCTSFPNQTTPTHTSEHTYLPAPSTTLTAITHLTQVAQVSSVVVLSSMFACALAMYTSTSDTIIGMVSANRGKDTKGIVNYFANTLPLRVNFSDNSHARTILHLLKHVKKNWSMVLDGALDLVDLLPHVPCLRYRGQGSSFESPLQVLFSYYSVTEGNSLPAEIEVSGVEMNCHAYSPKSGHTHTDLVLEVDPTKHSPSGNQLFTWEYRKSALTSSQVESLHHLMCEFIEATYEAFLNDSVSVPPLSLIPGYELSDLPQTSAPLPSSQVHSFPKDTALSQMHGPVLVNKESLTADGKPLCFIQRFEKVALKHPDSPAFVFPNGDTLTYKQVNLLATKIGLTLTSKGLKPGDHVAVLMSRSPWLYIAILGILRCAAAYVPIDTNDTRERGLKILKLANIKMLLSESHLTERFQEFEGLTVKLTNALYEELLQDLQNDSGEVLKEFVDLQISYDPERICYILFTSGTTGEPKGVAISERNLHATLNNIQCLFTPDDTAVSLAASNVSFDGHVADAIGPLLNHACLVIAESILDLSNPDKVQSTPALSKITYTFATPSSASVVTFPPTMRAIIVGGEVFSRACFENTLCIPKVVNGYGPTECCAFVTINHLPRPREIIFIDDLSDEDLASIGVPAPNVRLMVMDEEQALVPVGTAGVLHIAGPTVSSIGYYDSPELTKKAFFPNPLKSRDTALISRDLKDKSCAMSSDPEARSCEMVYCTGDFVRMLPTGKLQFLGRADDQVKLRGVRFQLLEVEHALSSCPHITSKVVFIKNQGTPSAQLVACVTPANVDINQVKLFATNSLPKYMVPSLIVAFDEIPLTKTGKVDKKLLEKAVECVCEERNGVLAESSRAQEDKSDSSTGDTPAHTSMQCRTSVSKHVEEQGDNSLKEIALVLAKVFAKVLGVPKLTPHDDFFASGGHSLLLFPLLREINRETVSTLNLSHVLQHTTPLQLAHLLLSQQKDSQDSNSNGGDRLNSDDSTGNEEYRKPQVMSDALSGMLSKSEQALAKRIVARKTDVEDRYLHVSTSSTTLTSTTLSSVPLPVSISSGLASISTQPTFDYLTPVPDIPLTNTLKKQLELYFQMTQSSLEKSVESSGRIEACPNSDELAHSLSLTSGVNIPADSLAHYSSLSMLQNHFKLKTVLSFKSQPNQHSVVTLYPKHSANETPLFFIHAGIIGWALPYRTLAQHMRTYSVAIQYTIEVPSHSFEAMASYYLDRIKSVQSTGPYKLVGVCYGALLVYEIARQLSELGERVKVAIMINNSPCPDNLPTLFTPHSSPLQGTVVHPYTFFEASLGLNFSKFSSLNLFNKSGSKCEDIVPVILSTFPWLPFSAQELIDAYYQFLLPITAVWSGEYQPKPLIGHIVDSLVLIRNHTHPLFKSHDYGLLQLVDDHLLSVIVSSEKLGLLSDKKTVRLIASAISLYLID